MASGYARTGTDFDALFQARVSAKIADVGFQVAGVDLSNRFEARAGTTAIANVGFLKAGVDLATLFRDINVPNNGVYADVNTSFIGYQYPSIGALSPAMWASPIGSRRVLVIGDYTIAPTGPPGSPNSFRFLVEGTGFVIGNLTSITINGKTYTGVSATGFGTSGTGGNTAWDWGSNKAGLAAGVFYPATIS